MNILVLGASRGIGLEFVRQYRAAGDTVIATGRDAAGLQRIEELGAKSLKLDVTDAASISGLGWQLDGEKFDIALYVAGLMSRRWRRWWRRPAAASCSSAARWATSLARYTQL